MNAINSIGQIAIAVSDIEVSKAFYRECLGLNLLFEAPPNLAFFDCAGVRLMLTTQQGPAADHHTSVIYYKVDNIEAVFAQFETNSVAIERPPQKAADMPDHQLWIGFIRDPDANLIGIMEEKPIA
ncbi:VOC family protein [Paraferrimonas sedimenticola]|uniref:VOC domain-containing protein n=1 Tax=Paraferrimonas sedimenticola TaxID=375674 RepID=A0AA37RWM8_9GAMM|nr:VOC family protein [Paraferrimonas sedimenticola]GLP96458.1 hypothetical protein GCM10007895_17640 [Paraferrimonas sedimenticola]